jgi:hypothetical protein
MPTRKLVTRHDTAGYSFTANEYLPHGQIVLTTTDITTDITRDITRETAFQQEKFE